MWQSCDLSDNKATLLWILACCFNMEQAALWTVHREIIGNKHGGVYVL